MNKRLVWNFEVETTQNKASYFELPDTGAWTKMVRWESRFFWPSNKIIVLRELPASLLDLSQYQLKRREDTYLVLPDADDNIKIRQEKLLYKPILQQTLQATAYGKKIELHTQPVAKLVLISKEMFVYRFDTTPGLKIELAKLSIHDTMYFSVSLESRSLAFVESLVQKVIPSGYYPDAHNYTRFLKTVVYV